MISSSLLNDLKTLLRPLKTRLLLMVGKVLIHAAKEAELEQVRHLTVSGLAGEEAERIEHYQEYGLCSSPPPGAEGIMVCPGGNRKSGIVIATESPMHRPTDLAEGDVALYTAADAEGEEEPPKHRIHMVREGRKIIVTCDNFIINAGVGVELNTEGGILLSSGEPLRFAAPQISLESAQVLFGPPGNQFELYGPEGRRVALIGVDCTHVETGSSEGYWPLERECGGS